MSLVKVLCPQCGHKVGFTNTALEVRMYEPDFRCPTCHVDLKVKPYKPFGEER